MKKEKISTNFLISALAILITSFIARLDYTTQTLNMDLDYNVYKSIYINTSSYEYIYFIYSSYMYCFSYFN